MELAGKSSWKEYNAKIIITADDTIPAANSPENPEAVLVFSDRFLNFFFFKLLDFQGYVKLINESDVTFISTFALF